MATITKGTYISHSLMHPWAVVEDDADVVRVYKENGDIAFIFDSQSGIRAMIEFLEAIDAHLIERRKSARSDAGFERTQ